MTTELDELAKAIYDGLHHEDSDVYADAIGGDLDDVIVDGRVDLLAVADKLLAAGWRKPRTVTTSEELDALPEDSVILTATGIAVQLYGSVRRDEPDAYHFALTSGPATILHVGAQP